MLHFIALETAALPFLLFSVAHIPNRALRWRTLSVSHQSVCCVVLCFVNLYCLCSAGNYMQMMIVLKPIAFDVVIYMTQLFDYYLYSVSIYIVHCESKKTNDIIRS